MNVLRRLAALLAWLRQYRHPIRPDGHDWPEWHHYTGEEQR